MQPLLKTHNRQSIPHPHFCDETPVIQLEITRGRTRDKIRPVNGRTFFIGSGSDCDLVLGGGQFPELHSYLLVTADAVMIRHLGSQPTLYVDGSPQSRCFLSDRSRIQIGPYEFEVQFPAGRFADATIENSKPSTEAIRSPLPSPDLLLEIEDYLNTMPQRTPPRTPTRIPLRPSPRSKTSLSTPTMATQLATKLDTQPGSIQPPATAIRSQNPAVPISIGLPAPSVKPPHWQHISSDLCVCQ